MNKLRENQIIRFLPKKDYAEQFLNGRIRLSTLNICTNLEANKRDLKEGTLNVYVDNLKFNVLENSNYNKLLGMQLEGDWNVNIQNANIEHFTDANVLCFSKNTSEIVKFIFGDYGVLIHNPKELLRRIHNNLNNFDLFYSHSTMDHIQYCGHKIPIQSLSNLKNLGFIKRKRFSHENEFRMLFFSKLPVKAQFIEIGSIRDIAQPFYI